VDDRIPPFLTVEEASRLLKIGNLGRHVDHGIDLGL
jgi:hypothetical protein